MDLLRWKTVNRIFHAALELPEKERLAFVSTESNGDGELAQEVERLLAADEEADSYLESPLLAGGFLDRLIPTPSLLQAGIVLCDRFEIRRLIGEGGMGHVYEAWDRELGVSVALKVIRPEISVQPEALSRFRQEVRLAHRITHPNVCRTYDLNRDVISDGIGNRQNLLFLTMEFLTGETLGDRLHRTGKTSLQEAEAIARQLADGIDAAHAISVIHRDIKPSNIYLTSRNAGRDQPLRVVITDFGLARLDAFQPKGERSSPTSVMRPIGTLDYMAPEQLQCSGVSSATDIYAFGLVLFEMVTGARAFSSGDPLTGLARRLSDTPASARAQMSSLPMEWERAIAECLKLKPQDRPQSCIEVIGILEGRRRISPRRIDWSLHLSSRLIKSLLVLVFLGALSVIFAGLHLFKPKSPSTVSPGALIYVAPLRNETGIGDFANITELVKSGVAQSVQVNLVDEGRAGDILQQMTKIPDASIDPVTVREIAMRAGAVRVIFLTASGSDGRYRLDVDVQELDDTPSRYRNHWSASFGWDNSISTSKSTMISEELLTAVRNASDWIRRESGESANDLARLDIPPADVTTNSWEALEEYVNAEKLQNNNETNRAVIALERSTELDPQFATAYGRLGDLLVAVGRYEEGYQYYQKALDLGQQRRLTRKERDRIKGEFAFDSFDFAAAEAAYRDYSEYYENDYRGWNFRGYPLLLLGRIDEAIATLRKAYAIDPARGNAPWELGRAYLAVGNFSEVSHWASVLRGQGDLGTSNYFEGVVQFLQHKYPQALSAFVEIQHARRNEDHSWSYMLVARVYGELGDYKSAREALAEGMGVDRANGYQARLADKLIARSYLEMSAKEYDACIADVESALKIDASPVRLLVTSKILGMAHFHADALSKATILRHLLALESRLPKNMPSEISAVASLRVHGEVLLAKDNWNSAIVEFRKASQMEAPTIGREYLARSFEIAAQHESGGAPHDALLKSAMETYAAVALRPNLMWIQPTEPLPGSYANELSSYLRLGRALHISNDQTQAAMQSLVSLRGPNSILDLGVRSGPRTNESH
jgi:serine/threonine protein kinase